MTTNQGFLKTPKRQAFLIEVSFSSSITIPCGPILVHDADADADENEGSHTTMVSSMPVPGLFSLFSVPVAPFLGPIEQADAPHTVLRMQVACQRASQLVIRLWNTGPFLPTPCNPSLSVDNGKRVAFCLGTL